MFGAKLLFLIGLNKHKLRKYFTFFYVLLSAMIYVLYSVLCSVTVSVLLKLGRQRGVDTVQMIIWNYPVAAALTYYFLKPDLRIEQLSDAPWVVFLLLAALLPFVFLALGASIKFSGIVKTEIAQRLSLVIPLLAAFLFFNEEPSIGSSVGVGMGLLAITFSIGWHKKSPSGRGSSVWFYSLIVFLGYGVIDILFKTVALARLPYTSSMFIIFCLALLVALGILAYRSLVQKRKVTLNAILWGLILGAFNFGNILFYMRAHRALPDQPSIVFTGMNIGVISLGALIGVLFFNEKLSRLNKVGLLLAIASVLIIAYYL